MGNNRIIDEINIVLADRHLETLTPKRTSTHGGEWCGPCPRCFDLTGDGGKDRFLVHPFRPIKAIQGAQEPCFRCRQCTHVIQGVERPWSGDLVAFVMWAYNIEFFQAMSFLDIDPQVVGSPGGQFFRSTYTSIGAPNELWQKRAAEFILEAEEILWSEEGAPFLRYLMKKRKLTEETIRKAHLGCVLETRFEEAITWAGAGSRVCLHKGIVIPEYHTVHVDGVLSRDIWSIAIRRDDDELIDEEADTGKKPGKYHLVQNSRKGVYGYNDIRRDCTLVLVEGQFDKLVVDQEGRGEFVGVAIQGISGGRNALWIARMSSVPHILLALDPDAAGDVAYGYWSSVFDEDQILDWRPTVGDFNSMLMKKQDVYAFLCKGRDKLLELTETLRRSSDTLRDVTDTVKPIEPVNTPLEIQNRQICLSDANRGIPAETKYEDVEDGLLQCDGPCGQRHDAVNMVAVPVNDEEAFFLCPSCVKDRNEERHELFSM